MNRDQDLQRFHNPISPRSKQIRTGLLFGLVFACLPLSQATAQTNLLDRVSVKDGAYLWTDSVSHTIEQVLDSGLIDLEMLSDQMEEYAGEKREDREGLRRLQDSIDTVIDVMTSDQTLTGGAMLIHRPSETAPNRLVLIADVDEADEKVTSFLSALDVIAGLFSLTDQEALDEEGFDETELADDWKRFQHLPGAWQVDRGLLIWCSDETTVDELVKELRNDRKRDALSEDRTFRRAFANLEVNRRNEQLLRFYISDQSLIDYSQYAPSDLGATGTQLPSWPELWQATSLTNLRGLAGNIYTVTSQDDSNSDRSLLVVDSMLPVAEPRKPPLSSLRQSRVDPLDLPVLPGDLNGLFYVQFDGEKMVEGITESIERFEVLSRALDRKVASGEERRHQEIGPEKGHRPTPPSDIFKEYAQLMESTKSISVVSSRIVNSAGVGKTQTWTLLELANAREQLDSITTLARFIGRRGYGPYRMNWIHREQNGVEIWEMADSSRERQASMKERLEELYKNQETLYRNQAEKNDTPPQEIEQTIKDFRKNVDLSMEEMGRDEDSIIAMIGDRLVLNPIDDADKESLLKQRQTQESIEVRKAIGELVNQVNDEFELDDDIVGFLAISLRGQQPTLSAFQSGESDVPSESGIRGASLVTGQLRSHSSGFRITVAFEFNPTSETTSGK